MKDYTQIEHINKYIEERMKHCYDAGYEQGRKDEREIHEGRDDVIKAFFEGILIGSMKVPKENVPQFPLSDKCCCEKEEERIKLVIDIPKKQYDLVRKEAKDFKTELCLMDAVADGIPLSEHVTNGEVIKALFPNIEISNNPLFEKIYTGIPFGSIIGCTVDATKEWWNAPYRTESEESWQIETKDGDGK